MHYAMLYKILFFKNRFDNLVKVKEVSYNIKKLICINKSRHGFIKGFG